MPERWPIAAKIRALKGNMSYRQFEEAIFEKTGKRINFAHLQQLATGDRNGRIETIAILAEYADKPVSWFYEKEYPDHVSDGYNIYHFDPPPGLTADSSLEEWEAVLADVITRSGIDLTEADRRQIAEAAAAVVATLARQKAASKKSQQTNGQEEDRPRRNK